FLPLPSGRASLATCSVSCAFATGVSGEGRVSSSTGMPQEPQNLNPGLIGVAQVAQARAPTAPGAVGIGGMEGEGRAVLGATELAEAPSAAPALASAPVDARALRAGASSDRAAPQRLHVREPIGLKVRHPSQTSPTS